MVITGLEVGKEKIKLVQLKRTTSGAEILEASLLPFTPPLNEEAIISSLKDFLKKRRIKINHLISSFPLSDALIRYLSLPSTSETEIKEMVNLEVPQLVPYGPEEIIVDYLILKREKDCSKVMAIIAPKEKVRAKINLLQKSGLEVEALELSPLPLCRFLLEEKGKIGLLNINPPEVEILFLKEGEVFFTRTFNLKDEEKERLSEELQKSFLQEKVDRLFLSGEFQKELPSFLKERLKVRVEVIDPARLAVIASPQGTSLRGVKRRSNLAAPSSLLGEG